MLLYPWDSLPPLAAVPDGNAVTLTWPLWARGWSLQSSASLTEWTTETAGPAAGEGGCRVTLERTAARKYFRLALP